MHKTQHTWAFLLWTLEELFIFLKSTTFVAKCNLHELIVYSQFNMERSIETIERGHYVAQ